MAIGINLKLLRKRLGKSQEEVAHDLNLTRSSYSGYENNVAQPNLDSLILFSDYYRVSIDDLVRQDLENYKDADWEKIDKGLSVDVNGQSLRILTTQVDENNEDVIEMIPMKASAGYTAGYADPDYVERLPKMQLPFLPAGKHRSFPIKGDSMPPLRDGSYVIGKYVERVEDIKSGNTYVVCTKDDGSSR